MGERLWPTYAAKALGLFVVVAAVLAALGGLVQINPIWLYGPFDPAAVSTAAQPDWYMGWLDGALRLAPAFRLHILGYRVPEIIVPAVIFPGLTFVVLFAWPAHRQTTHGRSIRAPPVVPTAGSTVGHRVRRGRARLLRHPVRRRLPRSHRGRA